MQNITMQELLYLFKVSTYFLGIIGVLIISIGGILGYFYKSDRSWNRDQHESLREKTSDHGERISRVEGELGLK